jgi:hypothetical protein
LLGNAGRNSIVGPGLATLDSSISRSFKVKVPSEMAQLQFRAEAFNLANRANFEPPVPNNRLFNALGRPSASRRDHFYGHVAPDAVRSEADLVNVFRSVVALVLMAGCRAAGRTHPG